jgi:Carbohydrate binding domain
MDEPNRADIGQVTKPLGQRSTGPAPEPAGEQERRDPMALPDRGGRHAAPRPDRPRLHLRPLIGLLGLVLFMIAIGILLIRVINQSQHVVGKEAATPAATTAALPPPVSTGGLAATRNLLRNWSFETDTEGWQRVGAARFSRELGGRTSGSSAFVQASTTGPSRAGIAAPDIVQVRPGEVYEASAWVRSGTPGLRVVVSLVVDGQGGRERSSQAAVTAADPGWVRVDIDHRAKTAGALSLEVTLDHPKSGEGMLVDEVTVRRA